jgi:hypothetical protein
MARATQRSTKSSTLAQRKAAYGKLNAQGKSDYKHSARLGGVSAGVGGG